MLPLSRVLSCKSIGVSEEREACLGSPRVPLQPSNFRACTSKHPPPLSIPKKARKTDDYHGILQALQSKNRVPKKWLGQHYMVNQQINEKLVEFACIEEGDLVVEIGPGTGTLTESLVKAGAHVIAVEKDPAMAELIMERFQENGCVEVVQEDFNKWSIRRSIEMVKVSLSAKGISLKQTKVVSNLPFNITTPVVKRILPMGDVFSSMVLLLQDEAASRLMDMSPQGNSYRPVSLYVRFFADAQYKLKVSRNNFFPRPNVDGAIALFKIKQAPDYPQVSSTKSFFTLVNMAFSGKRKMLRNSLQHEYPSEQIRHALKSLKLLDSARPDELTFDQFVALFNKLDKSDSKPCDVKTNWAI